MDRREVLLGPPASLVEPPGFTGLELLTLSPGDLMAFERMAVAVAEEADLAFRPDTDPTGVSARSASALIAILREFAATFAAAGADPRSRAWFAVAGALKRIHDRAPGANIGGSGPSPSALAYANLSLALAAYYIEGCAPVGADAGPLPPARLAVVAACLDPEAISRVRAQLSAELPADLFTRNVFDDLDARLGDAEAILRVAGAWGVPHWGEAASGGAHSELCERVAGFLREIAFDRNVAEAVEDETALAAWLATGYENMALAPTGQSVVPPSPADFERTGWSGAALSRVADDLERSAAPERAGRARKRAPAKAVPELIARLRAPATRLRRQDCQGR